eukprot:TRINITY_DN8742_c1_g1_i1.p1 TRINITY_DN8742_c1_g1~~TRINITY_DN8742_c1_g1_i1.p1  ORF type:complete len:137 (+),score=2.85 TRINITY_DN8742_c1_g1_i1:450-860(+)
MQVVNLTYRFLTQQCNQTLQNLKRLLKFIYDFETFNKIEGRSLSGEGQSPFDFTSLQYEGRGSKKYFFLLMDLLKFKRQNISNVLQTLKQKFWEGQIFFEEELYVQTSRKGAKVAKLSSLFCEIIHLRKQCIFIRV